MMRKSKQRLLTISPLKSVILALSLPALLANMAKADTETIEASPLENEANLNELMEWISATGMAASDSLLFKSNKDSSEKVSDNDWMSIVDLITSSQI